MELMQDNEKGLKQELVADSLDYENFDFDAMEEVLNQEVGDLVADLELLNDEREKIDNPEELGKVVQNVIMEQVQNQFAATVGEEFIKENHGNTLDLRNSAHIQTAENFEKGKIAKHNYHSREQLEKNYDRFKNKPHKEFRAKYVNPGMDKTLKRAGEQYKNGIETVRDIYTGRKIPTKTKIGNKNNPLAAQREHVNPSEKLYRNSSLQMAYNNEQLADIINDSHNLQGYTTAERNNRKSNKLDEEMAQKDKTKHYEKAKQESDDFIKQKEKEGEERLEQEGRQSQKEEAFLIGKSLIREVVMQLLADFAKEIIVHLVKWFKSGQRKLKTLLDALKEAIHKFVGELKAKVINVGKTSVKTIVTTIVGPVWSTLKKAWTMLKQSWQSLKGAIDYLRSPENKSKSLGVRLMEAGKIVIAGTSGIGAMVLSETIEKGLMTIPIFTIPIPLLGSLANILGMFFGAVISGLIGAIALNMINKLIAKKQKSDLRSQAIDKNNQILRKQEIQIALGKKILEDESKEVMNKIDNRHREANKITQEALEKIFTPVPESKYSISEMQADLEDLLK